MLTMKHIEDVYEYISESVDYTIEDEGIGFYEYGSGEYYDSDFQMRIVPDTVMVKFEHEQDQAIPIAMAGLKCDDDSHRDCMWRADMISCVWDGVTWEVGYDIVEG